MTIQELQRIVVKLSNGAWVRWWANFGDRRTDVVMAIQVIDIGHDGRWQPVTVNDIITHGFALDSEASRVYTVPRTNEDGTPYVPKLL